MAEEFKRVKDVRAAYRGHCTRNMEQAKMIMGAWTDETSLEELKDVLETVTSRMEKITLCDDKIEKLAKSEEIEKEVCDALQYNDTLRALCRELGVHIEEWINPVEQV